MSEERKVEVTSHNQMGGITAYQVNIGPTDRRLTEKVAGNIKTLLGKTKYQAVEIVSLMGDAEAERYATQIKNYLADQGIKAAGGIFGAIIKQGMTVERPDNDGIIRIKVGGRPQADIG